MENEAKQLRVRQGSNLTRGQIHRRNISSTHFDQIRLNSTLKNIFFFALSPFPAACRPDCPPASGICPLASAFRPPLPVSRRSAAKANPLPPVKICNPRSGFRAPRSCKPLPRKSIQAIPTCPRGCPINYLSRRSLGGGGSTINYYHPRKLLSFNASCTR
jgi:hypothetical protein